MKTLPLPPSANERVLAQEYHDSFTGVATDTIELTYEPIRTVDDVGLELVFKNGTLLSGAAGGASTATRETFTGIVGADFTLANAPVIGSELVFRNGTLIDDRAARTANVTVNVKQIQYEDFTGGTSASLTLANSCDGQALVFKNGVALRKGGGAAQFTVSGTTVTLGTAPAAPDEILVWYQWTNTASDTVTVDDAPGDYTIDAGGVITPSVAPVASDVFVVWYLAGGASGGGSAGYTIDGRTLTLSTALVVSDALEVFYAYRNN